MKEFLYLEGFREGLSKSGKPCGYIIAYSQDGQRRLLAFPFGGPGRHYFHEFLRAIFGKDTDLSSKDYSHFFQLIPKDYLFEIKETLINGFPRYEVCDIWRPDYSFNM